MVLKQEFDHYKFESVNFLRSNTVASKLVTAYVTYDEYIFVHNNVLINRSRGGGTCFLQVMTPVLEQIATQNMTLELDPLKVYKALPNIKPSLQKREDMANEQLVKDTIATRTLCNIIFLT